MAHHSSQLFRYWTLCRWFMVTLFVSLLMGVFAMLLQAWPLDQLYVPEPLAFSLWREVLAHFSMPEVYRVIHGFGGMLSFLLLLGWASRLKQKIFRAQFFLGLFGLFSSIWCVLWVGVWAQCHTWDLFLLLDRFGWLSSPMPALSQDTQSFLETFIVWWVSLWRVLGGGMLLGAGGYSLMRFILWISWRYGSSLWSSRVLPYFTKPIRAKEGLTDIRTAHRYLPALKCNYNPCDYFQLQMSVNRRKDQEEKLFFGLGKKGKPLFLPRSAWFENHVHILGATGMGKTLAASNLLVQCMGFGDSVLVMEGKRDHWAPHVLKSAAKACGRPFYFIDLNDIAPQFNLLKGITTAELTELFDAGFALGNLGLPSDHYKKWDRKLARVLARNHQADDSLYELMQLLMVDADETLAELRKAAQGFCLSLEEIASLGCLKTRGGVDFKQAIEEKAVVYVVGSLRDEAILALQKMILLRWMQCIEKINYPVLQQRVVLFLDEFTTMLSKPALQGVSTIRDKGGQMLLAHQSIGNLKLKTADLTPESVQSSIQSNTAIKLFFKVHDPAEQALMAKATSEIVISQASEHIVRNTSLSEQLLSEKRITDRHRPLITPEMIAAMPARQAIVMGVAPTAEITAWAPYPVKKQELFVAEAPPLEETLKKHKAFSRQPLSAKCTSSHLSDLSIPHPKEEGGR